MNIVIGVSVLAVAAAEAKIKYYNLKKRKDLEEKIQAKVFSGSAEKPVIVGVSADPDGGDGERDGSVKVDSKDINGSFGAYLDLGEVGTPGKKISVSTHVYNKNSSYVKYTLVLYNVTDDRVLAQSPAKALDVKKHPEEKMTLDYVTTENDKGDKVELRWVQVSNDSTARDIFIDNVKVEVKKP
ncbi:hypothetical protein ACFSW8_17270 [Rubritalea tangerina]|uniref:Uncharacterized protein n=2 Tax=Rubritalea tangerina TaxID=430798 RepID=A0ABW4ZFG0_9BACT